MDRNQNKLLFDIKSALDRIESYLSESKSFAAYERNNLLQDAVERNLEIIGEATNNLLRINPTINISNARRIVNTRNLLIHGYDEIENVNIWNIIINYLPLLSTEVENLLNSNNTNPNNNPM